MEWELFRSREVIWLKPRVNAKGEAIYYSKDGRTYNAEHVHREYEKMEKPSAADPS